MAKQGTTTRKTRKRSAPKVDAVPSPEATPTAVTSADAWVSKVVVADEAAPLPLPSGNVARVRSVGPEAFMEQGLIPDAITPMVERAIESKRGVKPKEVGAAMRDPKKMGAMLEMLDRTVVYAVVEPKVSMPPACTECGALNTNAAVQHQDSTREDYHAFTPAERKAGVLYVDRVDLDDKVFIMNYAMGNTKDLEAFRKQHTKAMASVAAVEVDEGEAE